MSLIIDADKKLQVEKIRHGRFANEWRNIQGHDVMIEYVFQMDAIRGQRIIFASLARNSRKYYRVAMGHVPLTDARTWAIENYDTLVTQLQDRHNNPSATIPIATLVPSFPGFAKKSPNMSQTDVSSKIADLQAQVEKLRLMKAVKGR